jgi:hypothetical protein
MWTIYILRKFISEFILYNYRGYMLLLTIYIPYPYVITFKIFVPLRWIKNMPLLRLVWI